MLKKLSLGCGVVLIVFFVLLVIVAITTPGSEQTQVVPTFTPSAEAVQVDPETADISEAQQEDSQEDSQEPIEEVTAIPLDAAAPEPTETPVAEPLLPTPTFAPVVVEPPAPAPPGCININTASFEELQEIINIGEDRAQQILELRPFSSVGDMRRISGIADASLQQIREQGLACVQ